VDDEEVRVSAAPQFGKGDPRTEDGELAFPALFPIERVEEQEAQMNSEDPGYAVAGQMQQLPIPRGGGKLREDMVQIIDPATLPPDERQARGWDFAGTDAEEKKNKKAAYTVGTRGMLHDGKLIVTDRFKARFDSDDLEKNVLDVVKKDGKHVFQSFPQDPGQAGKYQRRKMGASLVGHMFEFTPETGDKEMRGEPVVALARNRQFYVVAAWWNRDYIKCMSKFPAKRFRDDMDSTSRLLMTLTMNGRKRKRLPGAPEVTVLRDPSDAMVREAEMNPDAPKEPTRRRIAGPVQAVASGTTPSKKPWFA
jgi:predicted phage terminase large subunit-like protein